MHGAPAQCRLGSKKTSIDRDKPPMTDFKGLRIIARGPMNDNSIARKASESSMQSQRKGTLSIVRSATRVAILDFDGTLTDVEREGAPFVEGYKRDLAKFLGKNDIEKLWVLAENERTSREESFSWNYDGSYVAPASDPYIRSHTILELIFDKLGIYSDSNQRTEIKERLFGSNYKRSITAFREGAREFLEELIAKMVIVIVTNSGTDAVRKKLEELNPAGLDRVLLCGNAKKYSIDPSWSFVPEEEFVEGLDRSVLLRRRLYFNILAGISSDMQIPIRDMHVMGDIYDLDLPQYIGASTALITREKTYAYEKKAAQNVVDSFDDARAFFGI